MTPEDFKKIASVSYDNVMKKRKKGLMIGILSFAIIALIIAIGGKLYMDNKEKENLENQRKAALVLRKEYPNASKVLFTTEGGRAGFGSWGVSADVTIDSEVFVMGLHTDRVGSIHFEGDKNKEKKYDEIIDKNTTKSVSLEVEYSDGKQEIIK